MAQKKVSKFGLKLYLTNFFSISFKLKCLTKLPSDLGNKQMRLAKKFAMLHFVRKIQILLQNLLPVKYIKNFLREMDFSNFNFTLEGLSYHKRHNLFEWPFTSSFCFSFLSIFCLFCLFRHWYVHFNFIFFVLLSQNLNFSSTVSPLWPDQLYNMLRNCIRLKMLHKWIFKLSATHSARSEIPKERKERVTAVTNAYLIRQPNSKPYKNGGKIVQFEFVEF